MTVNTTNITSGPYIGNGASDTYSYGFRVADKTQLSVYETTDLGVQTLLVVDTDYTVNNVGEDAGGTITRLAGNLPADYQWYIRSNYIENQLTSFPSQGGFFPDVHEAQFDHLTFLVQQLRDKLTRQLSALDTSTYLNLTLPDPVAGYFLQWKADLSGMQNVIQVPASTYTVTAFVQTLFDDPDAQTFIETLGFTHLIAQINKLEFLAHEASTPDMTVIVDGGNIQFNNTITIQTSQTSPTITAPISNPRIDRIVIDNETGVLARVAGTEAASPAAPALPFNTIPVCQILLQTTTTEIVDSMITDERPSVSYIPTEVVLATPILLKTSTTTGSWQTIDLIDDPTLNDAQAKTATFRLVATTTEAAVTSSHIKWYARKFGSGLAIGTITQIGAIFKQVNSSTVLNSDTVSEFTLDVSAANREFQWYAEAVTGTPTVNTNIVLVSYTR